MNTDNMGDEDVYDEDMTDYFQAGRSMIDDIDDRINNEYQFDSVGVTARADMFGRGGFRLIPEE